jgi:acetyl esterase/lipase
MSMYSQRKRYIIFNSVKKIACGFLHRSLLLVFMPVLLSCAPNSTSEIKSETVNGKMNGHLTSDNHVRDIVNHSAFKSFGDLLLPWDDNSRYYDTRLTDIRSLMPYHSNVRTDVVLGAINHLIDEVEKSKIIFYNFYTEQQIKQDPGKRNTGLFFYRGNPNAEFSIVCPGGGFSYVGSLHEGFPLALEISKKGFNAFVIRYRIGSEQKATEDLAAAINYIFKNAATLGISTNNYSLWGGSAGARMVGNIALNGVSNYGGDNHPKPVTAVIAYTGHSTYSNSFPPTFITVSADDGIAGISTVERRVENLRKTGVEVEYRGYKNAGHGFGLGKGTDAEGWLDLAIGFWKKHIKNDT